MAGSTTRWASVVACLALALGACGGSDGESNGLPPTNGGDDAAVVDDAASGADATSPDAGADASPDADATTSGKTSHAVVSAGHVAKSASYKMVSTLGQSSPMQGVITSSSYKMRGGLIGATGGDK